MKISDEWYLELQPLSWVCAYLQHKKETPYDGRRTSTAIVLKINKYRHREEHLCTIRMGCYYWFMEGTEL